jgi:hypothetical protein
MSAMATDRFSSQSEAVAEAMPLAGMSESEGMNMSARLAAMRDTAIVLVIQLVFRATLLLRRWNY